MRFYRKVKIIKETAAASKKKPSDAVAIVSYDEKPGIRAIATTAPDLPPESGAHATFARDHQYKGYGAVSLLAGVDLITGAVHALVKGRHRSREFIEFLKLLDAAYPAPTRQQGLPVLDNHSAHISKEPKLGSPTSQPTDFQFTFTPKHGSWLNLVEGFFSPSSPPPLYPPRCPWPLPNRNSSHVVAAAKVMSAVRGGQSPVRRSHTSSSGFEPASRGVICPSTLATGRSSLSALQPMGQERPCSSGFSSSWPAITTTSR